MGDAASITPACPRCGYDQSGEMAAWTDRCPLEGRCPECGTVFLWSAALRKEPLHPAWSFEHATTLWGIAIGWLATPVWCILPGRYWKRMWTPEPVRIGRIILFLAVWWALVRTVWSVVMGAGMLAHQSGPVSLTNWKQYANAETFSGLMRFIGLSWAGTLPLIGAAGWDTEDRLEYYFLAGCVPGISLVWTLLLAAGLDLPRAERFSAFRVGRALLMSLVIVPITYESSRLLGAWQSLWFTGPPDAFLLAGLVLTVVWVLAWWSAVVRQASVGASGLAISFFHFAAVLLGGAIHIGVYLVLESML